MAALLPKNNPMPSPQSVRNRLLEMAGIGTEVQAKLTRRAIATMARKLKARKTHIVSHQGIVTERIDMEDNMAQLRAAEGIARLMGVEPSKDVNASAVKVTVEVKLPDWAKPVIDVTPSIESLDGQVLDDVTPQKD